MKWSEFDSEFCSVARTLEVLGDRWAFLVLRDVMNGIRRFDDLRRHLGIARDVLAKRLAVLVEEGILERVPYREPGTRTRYEYRPTQAGYDLRPALIALIEWGDRHRGGKAGPPVIVTHADCGAPVHVRVDCGKGHDIESRTRLRLTPGPGARRLA